MAQGKVGAPRRNQNRKDKKSVDRERISINMSISEGNGLLDLFAEYLSRQGEEPSNERIRELASDWAYHYWGERLKRELEMSDAVIIL